MKKIIAILLLTVMCFVLAACDTAETITIDPVIGDTARFQYIGKSELNQNGAGGNYGTADEIQYFVDNETQIIYIAIVNHAGNGTWAGFTPLIDADGTYVTYDEFKED
jgi:hypothetical protein